MRALNEAIEGAAEFEAFMVKASGKAMTHDPDAPVTNEATDAGMNRAQRRQLERERKKAEAKLSKRLIATK